MCGRYTIIATAKEIERRFDVAVPVGFSPHYNAAPTQVLPVITNENPESISLLRWGLYPSWAKEKSLPPMINSRIETITEKPTFRNALIQRRCLIPADGYYEWKRLSKKSKIPYRIGLGKNELFAFAGIWEAVITENQHTQYSFSIITTIAVNGLESLHNRMPLILTKENEKKWLADSVPGGDYAGFLSNNMVSTFTYYPVSSLVNSVSNEGSDLIKPTQAMDQFGNLDLFG